jgi:hypothetical protein
MLPQPEYGNIGVFTPFILYKFDPSKKVCGCDKLYNFHYILLELVSKLSIGANVKAE